MFLYCVVIFIVYTFLKLLLFVFNCFVKIKKNYWNFNAFSEVIFLQFVFVNKHVKDKNLLWFCKNLIMKIFIYK